MPKPRSQQISLSDTPYYHCVSRCVRRAFLCGYDSETGKDFEHRRGWVEDQLLLLGKVFAIDVSAYCVMSNHTHCVLYVDEITAKSWSIEEVLTQWHKIYRGTAFTQNYMQGIEQSKSIIELVHKSAEIYRERLMSISWFMKTLNEPIARRANKEDGCTGRFWEGRFKSQALLDEASLATAMAYTDLNPIRAKMANTPEESKHTSIFSRIKAAEKGEQPSNLADFVGNPRNDMPKGLPFTFADYLQLVELTGRCIRDDKRGHIDCENHNILSRLNISAENWVKLTTKFESLFKGAVGSADKITCYCENQKLKRRQDINNSKQFF